jgi:hypothetical protein
MASRKKSQPLWWLPPPLEVDVQHRKEVWQRTWINMFYCNSCCNESWKLGLKAISSYWSKYTVKPV